MSSILCELGHVKQTTIDTYNVLYEKHIHGSIDELRRIYRSMKVYTQIMEEANAMMGPGMRELFKDDLEKAEKRGLEQGLGRGEEKQRRTSVIRMLNLGRTPEAISDFTGEDLVYIKGV